MLNTTYTEQLIPTNGINLHVIQAGPADGPLVILLHGFPEFWYGWRHQIDFLAQQGFRVWVPDQRGYNLSDKPRGITNYRINHMVDDLIGLIHAARKQNAIVIGHDWGAMVAWWTTLLYPEKISKLGILNVPHPHIMMQTLRTKPSQALKSLYVGFFQIPWLPEKLISMNALNAFAGGLQKDANPGSFTDDDIAQYREAWDQPNAMTSMLNWYRAYVQKPPKDPQSWRISTPTLMMWGTKDQFLSAEMAQPSIDLCDKGELHLLNNATHWVQHDAAEQVNKLIGDFLHD